MSKKPRVVLVGLDEVVADTRERMARAAGLHPVGTPRYWDEALDGNLFVLDKPIPGSREYLRSVRAGIIYLSGRRQGTEHMTRWWLRHHGFPDGEVVHRAKGTPALEFKLESIAELQRRFEIQLAFGHGEPTEEAYRRSGLDYVTINSHQDWPAPAEKSRHIWEDL